MSFTGREFVFDGISGSMYGLMLCNFDGAKQDEGVAGEEISIIEDRIARRMTGLHYGITNNKAKEFPLAFVVTESNRHLDRYEVANIAGWLTGHHDYKELSVVQDDLDGVFYRCILTELEQIEVGMHTVGFVATVVCDGPNAYRRYAPTTFSLGDSVSYVNTSNVNDYYLPTLSITGSGDVEIANTTDGTSFSLVGLPDGERTIDVDCLNQVMTASDGINLYQYWNTDSDKYFPRFVRGVNALTLSGSGSLTIYNEVPWNIGH